MRKHKIRYTAVLSAVMLVLSAVLMAGCQTTDAAPRGNSAGTNSGTAGFTYDPSTDAIAVNTGDYALTEEEARLVALVDKVADTVVEITTSGITTGAFMQQYVTTGAGSGVVITSTGVIVTNNHVIEGAKSVSVKTRAGAEYEAVVLASDEVDDVAVLKIEATGLKAATFGDSDKLRVGQTVVAIGNPLGSLGGTVTEGIVSATDRQIYVENIPMTLLQTTAAINPGNSGGGLFNLNGDLVGVVNAKSSGSDIEGLGFAIPSNEAYRVAVDLLTKGYVTGRPYLGFKTIEITDTYELLRNNLQYAGVYVQKVTSSAPADIKVRDLIVSVNDTKISGLAEFNAILYASEVGDTLSVNVYRQSTDKFLTVNVPVLQYTPAADSAE